MCHSSLNVLCPSWLFTILVADLSNGIVVVVVVEELYSLRPDLVVLDLSR